MTIYTRFTADDIVEANPTEITTGLWSDDSGSLENENGYLYQNQISVTGQYYADVYNISPSSPQAEVQFAVAYGHIDGGGAARLDESELATLSTKAIYSQYRNLLLDPSDTKFTFEGVESDHIYVINFQRARMRGKLDPGNWELALSGAAGVRTYIDDSGQTLGALTANSRAGRVFKVISGSIAGDAGIVAQNSRFPSSSTTGAGFGLVYPDLGIIVLNPDAISPDVGFFNSGSAGGTTSNNNPSTLLTASIGSGSSASPNQLLPIYRVDTLGSDANPLLPFAPVTSSNVAYEAGAGVSYKAAYNHFGLWAAMKLALLNSADEYPFKARSAETISSTHYFVRLRNKEYNYSNNPTFYNPDNGTLVQSDFKNNPRVYITTVGLYNDQNELLAVAKLSAPLRKSFDEEILLRVRLDF